MHEKLQMERYCGMNNTVATFAKRKCRDGSQYRTWRCGTTTGMGKRHVNTVGNEAGYNVSCQIRDNIHQYKQNKTFSQFWLSALPFSPQAEISMLH